MDWICYVFKKGKHIYLIPDESEESAWISLAKRQSCSVENCKNWYEYKGYMNGSNGVWKI